MEQKIIQINLPGDLFICPICNKERKYACLGLCRICYQNERYWTEEDFRRKHKERARQQNSSGYKKFKYQLDKIGNMDHIEKLCLEHNLSPEVANAIAMDGIILDDEMRKRGMIK